MGLSKIRKFCEEALLAAPPSLPLFHLVMHTRNIMHILTHNSETHETFIEGNVVKSVPLGSSPAGIANKANIRARKTKEFSAVFCLTVLSSAIFRAQNSGEFWRTPWMGFGLWEEQKVYNPLKSCVFVITSLCYCLVISQSMMLLAGEAHSLLIFKL